MKTSKRNKMNQRWHGMVTRSDTLTRTFLSIGKKNGVSEELLVEVLDLLMKHQYLAMGDRIHVRSQLDRIISMHEGE